MTDDLSLQLDPRILPEPAAAYAARIPETSRRLFIFGLGYCGQYIARQLRAAGWRVGGTSRDQATRDEMNGLGIQAHDFNGLSANTVGQYDNIMVTIGPLAGNSPADPTLAMHRGLLGEHTSRWLGYISATSVYGETAAGDWIDETSATEPQSERGKLRLAAEQAWRGWHETSGAPLSLLRAAGIYGPGRSIIEQLQSGRARVIDKPGHVFNRIHVEDIARATAFRMAAAAPLTIDNLADGQPMSQQDWTAKAAALLGIEPPAAIPFEAARKEMTPMALSFWSESRKIRQPAFR